MSVICIANSKGGTGKTSVSLNLIHHLQPELIIDADIHKGISNLLSLGDNNIEIRHATSKQQIIQWTKTDKVVQIDCGGFDSDIEHFVSTQLSETGLRKLVTTLRVYLKRNSTERLQVEITKSNKQLLDKLVEVSGKTKIDIINQLIANAVVSEFKRPEEQ